MKKLLIAFSILSTVTFAQQSQTISGAGATFPFPLYQAMFSKYQTVRGAQVNYEPIGSGAGRAQILAQTVDFAASDIFMNDALLKTAPGEILHVPMAISALVPAYNLPGMPEKIKFTGDVLAKIYLGKITNWNDPSIAKLNSGMRFPDLKIQPVYRADGSGTTALFVDYLSKVSEDWAATISSGPQTTVKWRVGIGAIQSIGVANLIQQTPGAIGYIEVVNAKINKLEYGLVRNTIGKYTDGGNLKDVSFASDSKPIPNDTRVSFTNSDTGYPISGFTWVLVYKEQKYTSRTEDQAKSLVSLLNWMLGDGQKINKQLLYGQIDNSALVKAKRIVASMTYDGKPIAP